MRPPNKPMHPTADTAALINVNGLARRVIGGVRLFEVLTMRNMVLHILFIIFLCVTPSLVRAQQPRGYMSPDASFRVSIKPVNKSCSEDCLEIFRRNGVLLYRKDFSSPDCAHGAMIVRGEWSADSQFFVFNVESTGGHQPGHRPVFFYSQRENKLYRLENYIGYIVAQDFTLEAPHIIGTEKQKSIGDVEGVPIKVNLSQILRRSGGRRA
jgi:hypothetical protein